MIDKIKTIAELGDKAPAGDKSAAEAAIASLKTAVAGEDVEAIKAGTQKLTEVAMKIGEAVYKAQAEGAQAGAEGGAAPGGEKKADDGIVDADFEEVKDDKKKSA